MYFASFIGEVGFINLPYNIFDMKYRGSDLIGKKGNSGCTFLGLLFAGLISLTPGCSKEKPSITKADSKYISIKGIEKLESMEIIFNETMESDNSVGDYYITEEKRDIIARNHNIQPTHIINLTNTPYQTERNSVLSEDKNKILYECEGDIWIMNTDGSGRKNLTKTSSPEGHPEWVKGCNKFIYRSPAGSSNYFIAELEVRGGKEYVFDGYTKPPAIENWVTLDDVNVKNGRYDYDFTKPEQAMMAFFEAVKNKDIGLVMLSLGVDKEDAIYNKLKGEWEYTLKNTTRNVTKYAIESIETKGYQADVHVVYGTENDLSRRVFAFEQVKGRWAIREERREY